MENPAAAEPAATGQDCIEAQAGNQEVAENTAAADPVELLAAGHHMCHR